MFSLFPCSHCLRNLHISMILVFPGSRCFRVLAVSMLMIPCSRCFLVIALRVPSVSVFPPFPCSRCFHVFTISVFSLFPRSCNFRIHTASMFSLFPRSRYFRVPAVPFKNEHTTLVDTPNICLPHLAVKKESRLFVLCSQPTQPALSCLICFLWRRWFLVFKESVKHWGKLFKMGVSFLIENSMIKTVHQHHKASRRRKVMTDRLLQNRGRWWPFRFGMNTILWQFN